MYREKIRQLGNAALARHGTDLWIDNMSSAPIHSPEKKDSDFFTEHTQVSAQRNVSMIVPGRWFT